MNTKLPMADENLGKAAREIVKETIENCNVAKKIRSVKPKIKVSEKNKPIMTAETERQVEACMAMYEHAKKWKEWGMEYLRAQGSSILLHGKPGVGKSVIAEYIAARLGRGIVRLNMKDVGGKAPGSTERAVSDTFNNARAAGNKTIYIDECEAMVWDRSKAGADNMWMVGVIDEILMQISTYKGQIIMATNHFDILDSALLSRMLAVVEITSPELPERVRLWIQKIPERFPLKLTRLQIEQIAEIPLTGREIEIAIVLCASEAIIKDILPTFEMLCNVAKTQAR